MLSCVASLLLLGCLSCGEVTRGDTTEELSLKEQAVNAAQRIGQETCQSDIHAALREMSALTAELRTELRHTQQELKAAVDRLTESDRLIKALQVDLQQTQKEQSSTQQELQRTQRELQAAVDSLTDSDHQIRASVESTEAKSNATQHEVQLLQKLNEVKRVAFSASLLASGSGYTGPHNVETILVYRRVITNVGNGYNPDTGFFIAPVQGVYQLNIFIHGHGGPSSHASAAALYKNGQRVVSAWANQPTDTAASSTGAPLLLQAGDIVYVKLWANKRIYDDSSNYNSFSGHLLFTV